jgi:glucose uptake protein GlcU
MKKIKYILLILGLIAGFGLSMVPNTVGAQKSAISEACKDAGASDSALCKQSPITGAVFIKNLVNSLLYVLGAVSVIVIIIAGIFYTTSSGDAALVTKAKNTLLYAVVGLIVALLSYAIVNYVIVQFAK